MNATRKPSRHETSRSSTAACHVGGIRRCFRAAEFFAGIGLVGEALEAEGVNVVYANDIDAIKYRLFANNYDDSVFHLGDIREVEGKDIPEVDLATASFPCTDLSLAGNRAGLAGEQSGMFWQFARVIEEMSDRKPRVVLLENVVGFFSSNGGEDVGAAFKQLNDLGYLCDLIFVDAKWFLPQSRPRVFIVGSQLPLRSDRKCFGETPLRPRWFREFVARHPELKWQTFDLGLPSERAVTLREHIERLPADDPRWWDERRTKMFIESLSDINAARLERLKRSKVTKWRTAYRRTRAGRAVWEVREDAISGCLRTARGGSSKQAVVETDGGRVRVRWMTPREYARLQGVPEFRIDGVTDSQAMFGFGDAVCVPAVRYIVSSYLLPLLEGSIVEAVSLART